MCRPDIARMNMDYIYYSTPIQAVVDGMSEEEALQEARRCLRCDHFGYGIFKGGRVEKW